jgi:hypothetical protein
MVQASDHGFLSGFGVPGTLRDCRPPGQTQLHRRWAAFARQPAQIALSGVGRQTQQDEPPTKNSSAIGREIDKLALLFGFGR